MRIPLLFSLIKQRILQNKGAVLLMFALFMPIYLSFCALAIDGPLALIKKARLSDGINEALLAIAAVNNEGKTAADDQQNINILRDYLVAYMPAANVKINHLNVKAITQDGNIEYRASALIDIPSILPLETVGIPSFGRNIALGNTGNVVKLAQPTPIDMMLVVDFSRSMAVKTVPNSTDTRIQMLRKVVNEILTQGLKGTGSNFGIVPYDIGVPVKINGTNAAGGQQVGCSVQFVPKMDYRIDYALWADKFVDLDNPLLIDPNYKWSKQEIYWKMDSAMADYYTNVVLPAIDTSANPDKQILVNRKLCVKNDYNDTGRVKGKALYSCWSAENSIFTHASQLDSEYEAMIKNLKAMRSPLEGARGYRSIANIDSIDLTATMNKMFDPNNVTVFAQPWAPNLQEYRAFGEMCQSAMKMTPAYSPSEDVTREPDGYDSSKVTVSQSYEAVAKTLKSAKQNTFLIPLTNNLSDLNAFQAMTPSGGTDTISGVLRALPELMDSTKAKNDRRAMVIISDGFDSDPYGSNASNNLALTRMFITNGLCDRIRDEFEKKDIEFNMYFISLSASDLNQAELALWAQCVGEDKIATADSYQSLLSTLASILQSETGYFIN
jgi:tight adherence protein G